MHMLRISSRAAPMYSRGLKFCGALNKDFRTAAVNANRRSLSIFILQMFVLVAANSSCSVSMPIAFCMSPPNLLIVSIYSAGTDDAPCKTSGVFGIFAWICSNMSKRNFSFADFRLYAPWEVPIAIANESVLVSDTNFCAMSGSV